MRSAQTRHVARATWRLDKPVWVNAELGDNEREIIQLADIVAYTAAQACVGGACPMEAYYLWSEISSCVAFAG